MAHPAGESESFAVRLHSDRRLMLQFRGSVVTSDAGLLAYRELDDAIGLTVMASNVLADARAGKNGRRSLAGSFRQSVFGRVAKRLRRDPTMRWIVGGNARRNGRIPLFDWPSNSPIVMASVRTRSWLAARPKKREYSRLLGVHLGNPGSAERLSEEGDETGGE
jgi:hypothetical protein